MQRAVLRIKIERAAEFVNVRISVGKLFAGQFGSAGFPAPGSGEQRGHHAAGIAAGFFDARQIEQHRFPFRQELECSPVVRGGEIEFIALLSELGEFEMSAEGGGRRGERLLPALDACGQRRVDVVECLRGGGAGGGVGRFADAREDAAGFGFAGGCVIARFVAEKGVFEGEMKIRRFESEGFAELVARGFTVAGFEQRVGQVLMDVGPIRGKSRGLFEEGNGRVVIVRSQGIEGLCEGFVRGIFRFLSQRNGGDQAKRCKPDDALQTVQ